MIVLYNLISLPPSTVTVTVTVYEPCMMTNNEHSLKRVLSPDSVNITPGKIEDKRRRQGSIDIVDDIMDPIGVGEIPPSMMDLKKCMDVILKRLDTTAKKDDLNDLATKTDLKELDDRITAQAQKITQLRDELKVVKSKFRLTGKSQ